MSHLSTETITLDSRGMNGAIDALSSAEVSLKLKPRQRFIYAALMASVDLGAAALVLTWVLFLLRRCCAILLPDTALDSRELLNGVECVVSLLFFVSLVSGLLASLLGVPTIRAVFKEHQRLKALGLDSLATSFWRRGRSHSLWSGLRGSVLVCLGAFYVVGAVVSIVRLAWQPDMMLFHIVLFAIFLAALFLGAWILRVQKERIELASHAVKLKKTLLSLRTGTGSHVLVPVPVEFVRQAAMIELAHAAQDRRAAILQDAGKESSGYAVAFQPACLEQRAELEVEERLELEELLVELGKSGRQFRGIEVHEAATPPTLQVWSDGRHVEVEFTIDETARTISITRLRRSGRVAPAKKGSDA